MASGLPRWRELGEQPGPWLRGSQASAHPKPVHSKALTSLVRKVPPSRHLPAPCRKTVTFRYRDSTTTVRTELTGQCRAAVHSCEQRLFCHLGSVDSVIHLPETPEPCHAGRGTTCKLAGLFINKQVRLINNKNQAPQNIPHKIALT